MKIGVIVDNELNNDKRVLREIGILRESGHEIFVLCYGFNNRELPEIPGIRITRININRKLKDTLFFFINLIPLYESIWARAISRFIGENHIDAVHVHDLYMARAARRGIIISKAGIRMVLDLHENYPYAVTTYNWTRGFLRRLLSQPWRWQEKEREYLGYADRIIVLSEDFRGLLVSRYPGLDPGKVIPFPNVPDLAEINSPVDVELKVSIGKGMTTVLYYGVVAERRGIFDALEVLSLLAEESHPTVFLIIGPVDRSDRKRFFGVINSLKLRGRVYYIPWIDGSELPAYLNVTDICIAPFHKNPQHESGVANKIYDYMLGRKPVIASDCGPQMRLIEKYNCGIIYRNLQELKAAIEKLSSEPLLRANMGDNGYNAIIKENNMNLIRNRLIGLYNEFDRTG